MNTSSRKYSESVLITLVKVGSLPHDSSRTKPRQKIINFSCPDREPPAYHDVQATSNDHGKSIIARVPERAVDSAIAWGASDNRLTDTNCFIQVLVNIRVCCAEECLKIWVEPASLET